MPRVKRRGPITGLVSVTLRYDTALQPSNYALLLYSLATQTKYCERLIYVKRLMLTALLLFLSVCRHPPNSTIRFTLVQDVLSS